MLHKVNDYIRQNHMIDPGDRIVVGVSGGADSICLLHILHEVAPAYGAEIQVVHINHGIRGEEADLDEQFVKNTCGRLGIPFHRFYYNVKEIAQKDGLTEEEAGRAVRYDSFLEICRQNLCNKIAIAHNRNDHAETVLFHMFRGSGLRGLSGIDSVRSLKKDSAAVQIIRPLLCMERKEIEAYLEEHHISYRTDATNLTENYSRNKIRNKILAYAEKEINQNTIQHITEAAYHIKEMDLFVEKQVKERFSKLVSVNGENYHIRVNDLQNEDMVLQKGILRKILSYLADGLKDLEAKHVEQILSLAGKQVGKYVNLPYGIIARRDYVDIVLHGKQKDTAETGEPVQREPVKVTIPGRQYIEGLGKVLITEIISKKNETIPKNSCTKWFDYDKIENAVEIRTRRTGDFIQINLAGGRKKIKDYFIDRKIPAIERDNRFLIADGSHIMWILGDENRISERYKVDHSTRKILLMKLIDMEEI